MVIKAVYKSGPALAFVNVERLVVAFLVTRDELTGVQILLRLPANYDGAPPTVVVHRVGGEFDADDSIDHALVRIDTYALDKGAALDLTGTVRGLMWQLTDADGTVSDIAEQRGPTWLREPGNAAVSRYTTRFHVYLRAAAR